MCAVLATAVSDAIAVKIILNVSGVVTIVKSVAFALLSNNPHCSGIRQWGNNVSMRIDATPYQVPFNITMPGYLWSNATINSGDIPDIVIVPYIQSANANGLQILIDYETGHTYVPGTSVTNVLWIAIGCIKN